ncbi:DUF2783 domain-containing protein [Sulfitobacter sabulilitoris]|uniref:DUF2783 domain-containing protein n=1 Tax=Sulfitobacter sabulilitoris TaxID=2562655 RepID=A0A5S3PFS6_9RHOB|nr:DUF2783 domain-containing protein [Sulfitobacter sabulilitoris]TMM52930.1 DUF2783 domain-containing protein [Sulfitobacter sabulilitoris]
MSLDDKLGAGADDLYSALMAAHEGLSEAQSQALNARLVLILANEVGDLDRLRALIDAARSPRP